MNRQVLVLMGFILLAAFFAMPAYGQAQSGQTAEQSEMGQAPLRASQMMGIKVTDPQGNSVGTVGDLILSDQGNVEYLVLSQGGMFGFGSKMVPVPWDKVSAQGPDSLKVDIDQEKLKNAPSFSKSEWSQTAPTDFEQQVRGYYGAGEQQMQ